MTVLEMVGNRPWFVDDCPGDGGWSCWGRKVTVTIRWQVGGESGLMSNSNTIKKGLEILQGGLTGFKP